MDGLDILARRDALPHRDRKVAITAAADAEGDVDVEMAHGGKIRNGA
jgi:hypothetical protein